MLLSASYVLLTNIVYFPIIIACLVREDPEKPAFLQTCLSFLPKQVTCLWFEDADQRRQEMMQRWRADGYPGTKSITTYMRDELFKSSIFAVSLYQIAVIAGLYYYAEGLFDIKHKKLTWDDHKGESLFID